MFFANFSSTSSSIALHVSDKGTFPVLLHELECEEGEREKLTQMYFAIVTPPLRRITVVGINILEGDREVDEKEVEIVDFPKLKLYLGSLFHLLF